MRKIIILAFIALMLMPALPALAVSQAGKQYINQIVGGGYSSLRQASQSIFRSENTERKVLDVLAEKLLKSTNNTSKTGVDALSWACKALGKSQDIRYKNVLQSVVSDAEHAKVRKYAKQSLKKMPRGKAEKPYKEGSVNLAKMRKKMEKGQSSGKKKYSKKKGKNALSRIFKGMSIEEVHDILGEPTSTTSHVTGKSFNPYYHGSDYARLTYLYRGQGRILFSQSSKYSGRRWRVMEVHVNSGETGYP